MDYSESEIADDPAQHKQSHVLQAMGIQGTPIRISYGPELQSIPEDLLERFEATLSQVIQPEEILDLDDWELGV